MKKFLAILSLSLCAILLFGCSSSAYRVIEENGHHFLILGNDYTDTASSETGYTVVQTIRFSSVAEMKSDIQNGNFTERELQIISGFNRDETDRIQICDISKLYEPVFPQPFDSYSVSWRNDYYDFLITSSQSNMYVIHFFLGQEYTETEVHKLTHFEDNELITLRSKVIDSSNRLIYDYTGDLSENRYRMVYYCITNENDTLHIAEWYRLDESDSLPTSIDIYTIDGAQSSRFVIYNIQEPLTIDQLSQLGIREYVETVTE